MSARGAERDPLFDLAIVGSAPLTSDLRAALLERRFPFRKVRLLAAAGGEGQLTELGGKPRLVERAEREALEGVHLAFFCEDPATGGAYRGWPEQGGYLAIDLTLGDSSSGELQVVSGEWPGGRLEPRRGWLAAPHPLTHLLGLLLAPVESRVRIRGVRGLILRPAADFGQPGLEELYRQSVSLFNFAELPREVFARQLAFNLIPGEALDGGRPLAAFIASQVRSLLRRPDLSVSLFFAVAPVFHAHTAVLHLEFEGRPTEAALRDLLRASGELSVSAEPLTAVEVGEEPRPQVGLIRRDAEGDAAWLWAVAGGVSAAAANTAVRLAERMLGVEPRPTPAARRAQPRAGDA